MGGVGWWRGWFWFICKSSPKIKISVLSVLLFSFLFIPSLFFSFYHFSFFFLPFLPFFITFLLFLFYSHFTSDPIVTGRDKKDSTILYSVIQLSACLFSCLSVVCLYVCTLPKVIYAWEFWTVFIFYYSIFYSFSHFLHLISYQKGREGKNVFLFFEGWHFTRLRRFLQPQPRTTLFRYLVGHFQGLWV